MFDRSDSTCTPTLAEIGDFINNPLWDAFCTYLSRQYNAKPTISFSKCSWEYGWNIKFKKGSKALCTVYPRENSFVLMVVIGRKEKDLFEQSLPTFCPQIRQICEETQEGNGQRWLMIPLEDDDQVYADTKTLLGLRC
ncbi:MAG: DUF3788 domain-containing protein [Lachnospiraceae bacterium]|nr:DUF3788 domain-containing protein [Lachnospiraceae bacterium]